MGLHIYYYIPACPECGSKRTGRYVRQPSGYTGQAYELEESLRHGELIQYDTAKAARNTAYCEECGHEWICRAKVKYFVPASYIQKQIRERIPDVSLPESSIMDKIQEGFAASRKSPWYAPFIPMYGEIQNLKTDYNVRHAPPQDDEEGADEDIHEQDHADPERNGEEAQDKRGGLNDKKDKNGKKKSLAEKAGLAARSESGDEGSCGDGS